MLIASSHIEMRTVAIFIYTKICSGLLRTDLRENTMYTKNDNKKYCEGILTWEYRYKNSQTDLNLITNTKPPLLLLSILLLLYRSSLSSNHSLYHALPHETFCLTLASCFSFADKRYANCLTDNVPHNADKLLMNVLNIFRSGAWAMGGGRCRTLGRGRVRLIAFRAAALSPPTTLATLMRERQRTRRNANFTKSF